MRRALLDKYGLPTETVMAEYRNESGQTVTSEHLTWRWPSGTLVTLLERCGSLTPALYAVRTKPLQDAILKEQDDPDF